MKNLTIIFLAFTSVCFAQNSNDTTVNINNLLIAKIEANGTIFVADTTQLKKLLQENLTGFKLDLKSLYISSGITSGEKAEEYYLLIAEDINPRVKVAKPLVKEGEQLRFSDNTVFQKLLIVCEGDSLCGPNVTVVNSNMSLICGTPKECLKEADCTASKVLNY